MFNVSCIFRDENTVLIHDIDLATHLYRIAQEAVTNAVKHGHSREIVIDLSQRTGTVALSICDDGAGFPDVPEHKEGMGLRIMNYRANMMGAALKIQKNPNGGTVVTCVLPLIGNE